MLSAIKHSTEYDKLSIFYSFTELISRNTKERSRTHWSWSSRPERSWCPDLWNPPPAGSPIPWTGGTWAQGFLGYQKMNYSCFHPLIFMWILGYCSHDCVPKQGFINNDYFYEQSIILMINRINRPFYEVIIHNINNHLMYIMHYNKRLQRAPLVWCCLLLMFCINFPGTDAFVLLNTLYGNNALFASVLCDT